MSADPDELEAAHRQHADVCPYCGASGFDGQGFVLVDGIEMYRQRCWECGTRFATEVKTALGGDDQ